MAGNCRCQLSHSRIRRPVPRPSSRAALGLGKRARLSSEEVGAPLACATLTLLHRLRLGALSWLIFPAQALRLFLRDGHRPASERAIIAVFQLLGRFPGAQS